jgi:NDP-sugar pyrophosphorylase family protein
MKAMILAAGLGTRLRPLTDTRPKALVEINGRTLLEITLSRLRAFGVTEVIINVHHFADMVIGYLKSKNNFGMRIEISREDDLLLDTGGGLKKAARFFLEDSGLAHSGTQLTNDSPQGTAEPVPTLSGAVPKSAENSGALAHEAGGLSRQAIYETSSSQSDEPFLLHNVDVISTIDFRRMLQFHTENHALATLAVQSRESSRLLLFNDQLQLRGRRIAGKETFIPVPQGVIPSEARDLLLPRGRPAAPVPPAPSEAAPKAANCHSERSEQSAFSESPAGRPEPLQALAFSGIHVISPRLLPLLTEEGVFSIIDSYLRLAAQGEKILAFRADEYYWRDLGKPADLS